MRAKQFFRPGSDAVAERFNQEFPRALKAQTELSSSRQPHALLLYFKHLQHAAAEQVGVELEPDRYSAQATCEEVLGRTCQALHDVVPKSILRMLASSCVQSAAGSVPPRGFERALASPSLRAPADSRYLVHT